MKHVVKIWHGFLHRSVKWSLRNQNKRKGALQSHHLLVLTVSSIRLYTTTNELISFFKRAGIFFFIRYFVQTLCRHAIINQII